MAKTKQEVKKYLDDNINTNGVGSVTGEKLNTALNEMLDYSESGGNYLGKTETAESAKGSGGVTKDNDLAVSGKEVYNVVNKSELKVIIGVNKFDKNNLKKGYIHPDNGSIINGTEGYLYSNFINIKGRSSIYISGVGNDKFALGYVILDKDLLKVGNGRIEQSEIKKAINNVHNGEYLLFTCKTAKATDNNNINTIQAEFYGYSMYQKYEEIVNKIGENTLNKLSNKKYIFFGDSITTQDSGTINWPNYFSDLNGIDSSNILNLAASGASIVNFDTTFKRQQFSVQISEAVLNNSFKDADTIVISLATNDYQRKNMLGNYEDAMSKDVNDLRMNVILEAFRKNIYDILNNFKEAEIYYATPLQRASTPNSSEIDNNGGWLRDPLIRMCNRYGVKVIDQYSTTGIVKDFEAQGSEGRYLYDGLHTNFSGKILQAKNISKKINN